MKNILTLLLIFFTLTSCGVTLHSVVDSSLTEKYNNPLIVIPYEGQTRSFSNNLKSNLEETFSSENQKVEVILYKISNTELTLNSQNASESSINSTIVNDQKDIIIVFKPVRLQYYNGGLQRAEYQLIGTDIETKKEVWKANFSSSGSFGPSTFAKAAASKIYTQLKADGVL